MNTNLSKNIKLQVICLAYNQVDFIKNALDGFVMQVTNFPFEVLVGDDCSTDGTSDIIARYAKQYPDIIKHIKREKNMGAQANSYDLLQKVDADYLALCEGDDYWTNPNKLQIQVDLLEKEKHLNGCFHKAEIRKEPDVIYWNADKYFPKDANGKQYWPANLKKKYVQMPDVLPGLIATSSIVYRYRKNFNYPDFFKHSIAGDRPLHCFMIGDGSFKYIDYVMSVYRISHKGVWFDKNNDANIVQETKDWVALLENLSSFFDNKYECIEYYKNKTIEASISKAYKAQNIEALSELANEYKEIFFKNILHVSELENKKIKYKILGIPILKIKESEYRKKYYLFGFIPIMQATSNRSFYAQK